MYTTWSCPNFKINFEIIALYFLKHPSGPSDSLILEFDWPNTRAWLPGMQCVGKREVNWRIVGFGTFSSLNVRRRTDKSAVELRAWFFLRKVSIHAILLTKLCSYAVSRYELLFCLQCWYSRLTQISLSTSVSRLKFRYFPLNFLFLSRPILASFERMWFQDKIVKQIPLNVVSLTWATDYKIFLFSSLKVPVWTVCENLDRKQTQILN